MSDRQIMAAFFPDMLKSPVKKVTYREAFFAAGRQHGMSEVQIEGAWKRQGG